MPNSPRQNYRILTPGIANSVFTWSSGPEDSLSLLPLGPRNHWLTPTQLLDTCSEFRFGDAASSIIIRVAVKIQSWSGDPYHLYSLYLAWVRFQSEYLRLYIDNHALSSSPQGRRTGGLTPVNFRYSSALVRLARAGKRSISRLYGHGFVSKSTHLAMFFFGFSISSP